MKTIKFYNTFFYSENKKLYGFIKNTPVEIDIINQDGDLLILEDFFKKNDELYFKTKEIDYTDPENPIEEIKFFKQKNEDLIELEKLPNKPSISRVQLKDDIFSIQNFRYESILCSDVKNLKIKSGIERFYLVDGYSKLENGLLFNVSEGRPGVKEPGLYFWSENKFSIDKIFNKGILYN